MSGIVFEKYVQNKRSKNQMRKIVIFILVIAAFALILTGILKRQYDDVWRKSSAVCLECIGIG